MREIISNSLWSWQYCHMTYVAKCSEKGPVIWRLSVKRWSCDDTMDGPLIVRSPEFRCWDESSRSTRAGERSPCSTCQSPPGSSCGSASRPNHSRTCSQPQPRWDHHHHYCNRGNAIKTA